MLRLLEHACASVILGNIKLVTDFAVEGYFTCFCNVGQRQNICYACRAVPNIAVARNGSLESCNGSSSLGVDGGNAFNFADVLQKLGVRKDI